MAGVFFGIRSLKAQASCAKIIFLVLLALETTQATTSLEFDQLWRGPCVSHNPQRHPRSSRSPEEIELNLFIINLNKIDIPHLRQLYPHSVEFSTKPPSNCPRVNKMVAQLKKAKTSADAYKTFQRAMLHLNEFLDKLQNIRIKTDVVFEFNNRTSIYENVKNQIRLALCEVGDSFRKEFGVTIFYKRPKKANTKCVPEEADLSHTQSLDLQFFKKLRKFLKAGKRTFKKWKNKSTKNRKMTSVSARTRSSSS